MMSFTLKMTNDKMRTHGRLEELEMALQRIRAAKKQLGRNTAEAKSRIQCNISRQLEALRNREVWLLNQLDTISGVKEEVLQQQSVRLNKTLGILQSTLKYPDGSEDVACSMDRLKLDLQPEETPHVSFKSDPSVLRDAIMNYGRIDANSVTGIQSPFMDPDHQAPSLPRHFEDYNDAEHHVLYKTVEELNRTKMMEPAVHSITPKLSSRMEDWLMPASKTTGAETTNSNYTFTFPKLSNNLSDWLRPPVCLNKESSTPIDDLSTDASIQTWLHKIKQCPMEEEDDYEFIEDDAETRTLSSELELFPDPEEEDTKMWLYKKDLQSNSLQMEEEPSDRWLHKSNAAYHEGEVIDMSRYFTKITDEMDKWLLKGVVQKQSSNGSENIKPFKPTVPCTLELTKAFQSHVSRVENPWLLRSTTRSSSRSPSSSCRSSVSSFPTQHKVYNKWLLNGGLSENSTPTKISCPSMDKFKSYANSISWLKTSEPSVEVPVNPMANFLKSSAEPSTWLRSRSDSAPSLCEVESPFKRLLGGGIDNWLQKPVKNTQNIESPLTSEILLSKGDNSSVWLSGSLSSFPQHQDDIEEIDL